MLSLSSGSLLAGPEDCLTFRDNPHVAACANQYGPGSSTSRSRPAPSPVASQARAVQTAADSDLRTVAVIRGGKPPTPIPEEPPRQTFAVDRTALTDTVIAGAVGGSLLVLVALGVWRWSRKLTKSCPYCGSKMSLSARSCRRCFRAA